MKSIFADKVLLPTGWADDVRITTEHGRIRDIHVDQRPSRDDWQADCVIPGLANAHSHAFQRALAGRTERRSPGGRDTFWTWRERMYSLANAVDPERLRVIARQAYAEMLCAGYTSVAEFHYLHRSPGSDDVDKAMFKALRKAAADAGIRLCYVPVLYERAGFSDDGPLPEQARFALDVDTFLSHVEDVRADLDTEPKRLLSLGIGAHSIRAVTAESLARIADWANSNGRPMHIHIAEQQREVDQALAFYGRRPVRWLLENHDVRDNWCLVHATHMDPDEVEAAALSGAVACLCPSTEANLGDGLFALRRFLEQDGRIAIGSDSHISINPYEELRWLEYGQRLAAQSRNVAAVRDSHTGRELFERALDGGARALGRSLPGLVEGADADLVCLYGEDPMLAGHDDRTRLDAIVFSGYRFPVERVMVGGRWVVKAGEHRRAGDTRTAFASAVRALADIV
ncbi:MAG: formimidoylglutamate deiminase [Pseudomonadota bacterium]